MYGEELIEAIVKVRRDGNKVLICGNGGLCAVAEHFSAEMVSKFAFDIYIPCVALTANTSLLTALANDMGFDEVFAHQVGVLGYPGDILIAMTTSTSPSGSPNIAKAVEAGNRLGLTTVVLCAPDSPDLDARQTYRMGKEGDAGETQDTIMSFLHGVALAAKLKLKR